MYGAERTATQSVDQPKHTRKKKHFDLVEFLIINIFVCCKWLVSLYLCFNFLEILYRVNLFNQMSKLLFEHIRM